MDLNKFISDNITNRTSSMFENDISANIVELNQKINNKTVLVIGGAGTIGSSFIKSLLHFKPNL